MRKFEVAYADTFLEDLTAITMYVFEKSGSRDAATRFYNDILETIDNRSFGADCYEKYLPYDGSPEYYRIYFGHYTIFYVFRDGIMDVRRILLSGTDFPWNCFIALFYSVCFCEPDDNIKV